MNTFLLVRHAHAYSELSPKGVDQAKTIADKLIANDLVPDVVLHSPILRAFQTAKIITERVSTKNPEKQITLREVRSLSCEESAPVGAALASIADEAETHQVGPGRDSSTECKRYIFCLRKKCLFK